MLPHAERQVLGQKQTCSSLPASLWEALLLRSSLRASLLRQAHCRRTTRRRYSRKALRAWYRRQLRWMHRAALCCLHSNTAFLITLHDEH